MKSRVLFITLLIVASALAKERWTSPDKFYAMSPPSDWSHREDAPSGHRSFAWISRDQKAEIHISATYDLVRLPADLPDSILEAFFPNERGVTPMKKVRGTGWDGLRREYTNADQSTRWLAVAARKGTTVVGRHDERTGSRLRAVSRHVRICLAVFKARRVKTSSNHAMERTADRRALHF
jgi:hypothetical protein